MKAKDKELLRAFIVNRLREVTRQELDNFAFENGFDPFNMAEGFDREVYRIEKLFNFPTYGEDQ
jgi:hypothetical protein